MQDTNKYIRTLDYGEVLVRYNKLYVLKYIDTIDVCEDDMYDIYTNRNGELVAIKNEELKA